jgi:hypothetical protein
MDAKKAVDCQLLVSAAAAANVPKTPEGFDPGFQRGGGLFGRYYVGPRYGALPPATQASGRLEKKMLQLTTPSWRPERRSYVAIVDRSAETPLGVESASMEASFHVILGKY